MSKKTLIIFAGIVVIVGSIAGILFVQRADNVPYELVSVQRENIIQEVSASGKVESPTKIDLHFKNSGKLIVMNAKVGEEVSSGQLLAKQDTAQLDAQVSEMQAGIDVSKARLNQSQSGASLEDIAIAETTVANAEMSVANAQQSLVDAKQGLIDKLHDTYTKADDAIRNKSDLLFRNPRSADPQLIFISAESQLENEIEWERILIESTLKKWTASLNVISAQSDLTPVITLAHKNIGQTKMFLDKVASIVNNLTPLNSNVSQSSVDKWKSDISTARININAAISNLSATEENFNAKESGIKTAEGNLKIAQIQLALKKAPARPFDTTLYEAQIRQAEALLQKTLALREDLMVFAPSSGLVTEVNGEVGEIIGSDKVVASLAAGDALQIKLNVVEDNIVNVRVGQMARILFDAIEKQEFVGKVVAIDPAETVAGGVVYYQTTVLFEKNDERIRSGMTANVWIKTSVSEKTFLVPASAVRNNEGKKTIQVYKDGQKLEKEVVVGIKNNSGMIEIISGLTGSEEVILGNKKQI